MKLSDTLPGIKWRTGKLKIFLRPLNRLIRFLTVIMNCPSKENYFIEKEQNCHHHILKKTIKT